ncbi:TIGR02300 family protein [Parapedomonas caeni]
MVKPEWGSKQTCPRCNTRFYDLGKADPVTCINCGNAWVPEPILKSKQPLPFEDAAKAKARVDGEEAELIEADDLLDADLEDADDSTGDVSLDDDDADLSEVVDPGMEEE